MILAAPADAKFMIGCTNSAHPTACAVALRNLQIFDDEGLVDRAELMAVQRECAHCLSEPGPAEVSGTGNFVLPVQAVEDFEDFFLVLHVEPDSVVADAHDKSTVLLAPAHEVVVDDDFGDILGQQQIRGVRANQPGAADEYELLPV